MLVEEKGDDNNDNNGDGDGDNYDPIQQKILKYSSPQINENNNNNNKLDDNNNNDNNKKNELDNNSEPVNISILDVGANPNSNTESNLNSSEINQNNNNIDNIDIHTLKSDNNNINNNDNDAEKIEEIKDNDNNTNDNNNNTIITTPTKLNNGSRPKIISNQKSLPEIKGDIDSSLSLLSSLKMTSQLPTTITTTTQSNVNNGTPQRQYNPRNQTPNQNITPISASSLNKSNNSIKDIYSHRKDPFIDEPNEYGASKGVRVAARSVKGSLILADE